MANKEKEWLHPDYTAVKVRNTLWDLRIQCVVGCALLAFKHNQKWRK